jgi:hypothetical protein
MDSKLTLPRCSRHGHPYRYPVQDTSESDALTEVRRPLYLVSRLVGVKARTSSGMPDLDNDLWLLAQALFKECIAPTAIPMGDHDAVKGRKSQVLSTTLIDIEIEHSRYAICEEVVDSSSTARVAAIDEHGSVNVWPLPGRVLLDQIVDGTVPGADV